MIVTKSSNMIKSSLLHLNSIRRISEAALDKLKPIPTSGLIWKTDESDPRKHNDSHEGLFYLLPDEKEIVNMFGYTSPFRYNETVVGFHNTIGMKPLMIRKPALAAMRYIEKIKQDMPNLRVLFYGDYGHGATHTLTHLLHYLHLKQEHVIVHIREIRRFAETPREYEESITRPGRTDTNTEAALFLQQFRIQNAQIVEKLGKNLVCSKSYKWSLREESKAGSPLIEVAEHGVNRVIHASDCVAVLMKELSMAADEGKIKLASLIDDCQFLFNREASNIKHPDGKFILVDEMTVPRALKKLIKGTHKNGLVLATCYRREMKKQRQTPADAIGEEGWKYFDPFLPIHLPKYSRKEFESCMNMYQSVGWLCRPESRTREARDELRWTSGMNPRELEYLCKSL